MRSSATIAGDEKKKIEEDPSPHVMLGERFEGNDISLSGRPTVSNAFAIESCALAQVRMRSAIFRMTDGGSMKRK